MQIIKNAFGNRMNKKIAIVLIVFALILNAFNAGVISMFSFASIEEVARLTTIEDVEDLIKMGGLNQNHYINDFDDIAKLSDNEKAYHLYLNAVWLSHTRRYKAALDEYKKVLVLLEESPNITLEMITLEKILEITDIYSDLIDYQNYAFRLREISIGNDDKLYIKALYSIASAHFQAYNDKEAMSYLTAIYDESLDINYSLGLSFYHSLYGQIELSYNNFEDAKYHFEKAKVYNEEADQILGYAHDKYIELQLASINTIDGNYQQAYDRIGHLIIDIDRDSDYEKRDIYFEYGKAALMLGRHQEAIKYYQLALVSDYIVSINYEAYSMASGIYTELGFAYAELNRFEESVDYFIKSYDITMVNESDELISNQVSALNSYEIDELQRELELKRRLRDANEETINVQRKYIRNGVILSIALFISLMVMVFMVIRKNKIQKKLYTESITDHLTKVFNRGYIIDVLEESKDKESCIMMMDIDDFKMINDTFGHVVGDKVLVRVAKVIEENLREEDSIGRYGGEEFLVVLKNSDVKKAWIVAERIRAAVEAIKWIEEITTTISIGMMPSRDVDTDELLAEADILMYRAKKEGKNRVVCEN